MLPELADGVLPEGVHDATLEEVQTAFGRFQRSDRRIRLTETLRRFVEEARRSGLVEAIILDGSYVTAKEEPSDIDLLVEVRPEIDQSASLRPFEYNVVSRRAVRRDYHFDLFVGKQGDQAYQDALKLFARVRTDDSNFQSARQAKGMVRVVL